MIEIIMPGEEYTNDYPREILSKTLDEFRECCEEVLPEMHSTGRLMVEARLYGQLIQLFDKYNLKTRGISLDLKIGYYETEIGIHDYRGREIGLLSLGQGKIS